MEAVRPSSSTLALFLVPLLLLLSAGFSVGLTFAPCYSSLCVERYFPFQTRLDIALYYTLLAIIISCLYLRRFWSPCRQLLDRTLLNRTRPFIGSFISIGGLLIGLLIAGATFATVSYWYPAEHKYWMARGALVNWTDYIFRVVWTGVTGHWCDIWMGLVVIPVGRRSILGEAFHLHHATLLLAHKLIAYGLLVFALIHGFLYYSFLAAWVSVADIKAIMEQFNPDNPNLTWTESMKSLPYSWFVLPTGAIAGLIVIPIMVITSLPKLRSINYNVFYFTHVVSAVILMILVCLHASTNFYFLLPGLLLWVGDWTWRITHRLKAVVEATIENAGEDWYRIRLPPDHAQGSIASDPEKSGSAVSSERTGPLATYYLNFSTVSKLEIHPFTAAHTGSSSSGPIFLFRKSRPRKKQSKSENEWTWKVAEMAACPADDKGSVVSCRCEGPYMPQIPEMYDADHIIIMAGGTGVTGALSIGKWWATESNVSAANKSFSLIWTIRERSMARLAEWEELHSVAEGNANMALSIRVSSEDGRFSPDVELGNFIASRRCQEKRIWVYISGPDGLMESAEMACIKYRTVLRSLETGRSDLHWYAAKYST